MGQGYRNMLDRKGRVDGVGSKETTYFPNVGVKVNFMFPRHVNSIHTQNITREAREGHVDMNGKFLTPLHIH
jgi:hypothetical protein